MHGANMKIRHVINDSYLKELIEWMFLISLMDSWRKVDKYAEYNYLCSKSRFFLSRHILRLQQL